MDWKASTDADDAWGWHAHRAGKPKLCSGTYLPVNGAVTEFNNNMIDRACVNGEKLFMSSGVHAACVSCRMHLFSLSSLEVSVAAPRMIPTCTLTVHVS